MIKRMIIMLVLCILILGGLFGFKAFGNKMMMAHFASMGDMPQTVSTITVQSDSWVPTLKAVGTLRAAQGSDLSAELSGTVEHIFIDSGQDVTEGTVLLQLNAKEEIARLNALKAQETLAKITLERDEKQIEVKAISQATYDADKAQLDNLSAQVDAQKALLMKKIVVAPFSGRLGIRKVDVGQYINAGEAVVTLQQLNPIFLDFFIPQQKIGHIKVGQKVTLTNDALKSKKIEGKITAINSKVDPATRNVEVRATFTNPDKTLRPGMFATAVITTGKTESHLTLPQTAVTFNPYGNTVFIVNKGGKTKDGKPKLTVKTAFIETGKTRGDQVAILKGLKKGDEVVTAGQLKLRNGSVIAINNSLQPLNDANPQPKDH